MNEFLEKHDTISEIQKYTLRNLAIHLSNAGKFDGLCDLLTTTPEWMRARHEEGGYLQDLDLAIQREKLRDEVRSAVVSKLLIAKQIVNQQVDIFDEEDLETLVYLGRTEEALGYVRYREVPKTEFMGKKGKVNGLLTIWRTLDDLSRPNPKLMTEIVKATNMFEDDLHKGSSLDDFVFELMERKYFEEAFQIAHSIYHDGWQKKALRRLMYHYLNNGDNQKAIEITKHIRNDYYRADARSDLAISLVKNGHIDLAKELVRGLDIVHLRAWAMCAIVSNFPELESNKKDELLLQVENDLQKIDDPQWRAVVHQDLAKVKLNLGDPEAYLALKKAKEVSISIEKISTRVFHLRKLIPIKSQYNDASLDETIVETIDLTCAIENVDEKIKSLAELVQLLDPISNELVDDILEVIEKTILEIEDEWARDSKLKDLTDILSELSKYDEALEIIHKIEKDTYTNSAIQALAAKLADDGDYSRCLEVINMLEGEIDRGSTLKTVVDNLTDQDKYNPAILLAEAIVHNEYWAEAVCSVAEKLAKQNDERADDLFEEVFFRASTISEDIDSASLEKKAQGLIISDASTKDIIQFVTQIQSKRYVKLSDSSARNKILSNLSEILAKTNRHGKSLEVLQYIDDPEYTEQPIVELIKVVDKSKIECLIDIATNSVRKIKEPDTRGQYLRSLANSLSKVNNNRAEDFLKEGLISSLSADDMGFSVLGDNKLWGPSMKNLAIYLTRYYRFSEAMEIASLVNDQELAEKIMQATPIYEEIREELEVSILGYDPKLRDSLSNQLASQSIAELLESIHSIEDNISRTAGLRELAAVLVDTENNRADEVIKLAENATRSLEIDFFFAGTKEDLRNLELSKLAAALASVGRFDKAKKIAFSIQDDGPRSRAQLYIVKEMLSFEQFEQAEKVASSIEMESRKEEALEQVALFHAINGDLKQSISLLEDTQLNQFLYNLTNWAPAIEQRYPGLALDLIQDASRIAGWFRPDWRKVNEIISPVTDIASLVKYTSLLQHRKLLSQPQDLPVNDLIMLLKDENEFVRRAALNYLLIKAPPDINTYVLASIDDADDWVRIIAIRGAQKLGIPEAIPKIIEHMQDENQYVQSVVVEAVKKTRDPIAIPRLVAAYFEIEDLGTKENIQEILVEFADPQAIDVYLDMLSSPSVKYQGQAIDALNDVPDQRAIPRLIELLRGTQNLAQETESSEILLNPISLMHKARYEKRLDNVIQDFQAHGMKSSALQKMQWRRNNINTLASCEIIDLLAILQAKEAAPEIEKFISDQDLFIRESAVAALGELGREESKEYLVEALQDENIVIPVRAANSLAKLGEEEAVKGFLLDWWDWFTEDGSRLEKMNPEEAWSLIYFAESIGYVGEKDFAISLLEGIYDMCGPEWTFPQRACWDLLRKYGVHIPNEVFEEATAEKEAKKSK